MIGYTPPPDLMENIDISPGLELGHKWYVNSADVALVVSTPHGPIDAAMRFLLWAKDAGRLGELGTYIDANQTGRIQDTIFRRVLEPFARRKLGWGETLLNLFLFEEHNRA